MKDETRFDRIVDMVRELNQQETENMGSTDTNLSKKKKRKRPNNPAPFPANVRDMSQDQLQAHVTRLMMGVKGCEAADTVGTMVILFQEDGQIFEMRTANMEGIPGSLRNLANDIEQRERVAELMERNNGLNEDQTETPDQEN